MIFLRNCSKQGEGYFLIVALSVYSSLTGLKIHLKGFALNSRKANLCLM